MRVVTAVITAKKVHVFSSWSRAIKVSHRAKRMGAAHEFVGGIAVKAGDPYKSKKLAKGYYGVAP